MSQEELDKYYLNVAKVCANNSKAIRKKVGAILVKKLQIISDGFNGTPRGFDNCCEDVICKKPDNIICNKDCFNCKYAELVTKSEVLHAETSCLMKACVSGNSTEGGTLYVTLSPCINCAKLIIQAEIKRVVYLEDYRDNSGIELLKKFGIEVVKLNETDL